MSKKENQGESTEPYSDNSLITLPQEVYSSKCERKIAHQSNKTAKLISKGKFLLFSKEAQNQKELSKPKMSSIRTPMNKAKTMTNNNNTLSFNFVKLLELKADEFLLCRTNQLQMNKEKDQKEEEIKNISNFDLDSESEDEEIDNM